MAEGAGDVFAAACVVGMDHGSAHTAKVSRLTLAGAAPHVIAHWLPPYCSDLNVIETLWKLIEHVKAKLARYKAPRFVEWMDALPRNDRGKIEKKKLTNS